MGSTSEKESRDQRESHEADNSLTLTGAVAIGTGVMIDAGIFALTGQVAELAGPWFSLEFPAAAVVTAFSAYAYVRLSNAYPSAGGTVPAGSLRRSLGNRKRAGFVDIDVAPDDVSSGRR